MATRGTAHLLPFRGASRANCEAYYRALWAAGSRVSIKHTTYQYILTTGVQPQASSQEMTQDRRGAMVDGEVDPSLRIRNYALHGTMVVSLHDGLAEVHARVGLGSRVLRDHSPSPPELFF